LQDQTALHRERVIAEYADNEEAMIRTQRWKLIYSTGARRRRDRYFVNRPEGGPVVQLYDLDSDPAETMNLAGAAEHAERVEQFTGELADHLMRTARDPQSIPKSGDVRQILAYCIAPQDQCW
jgi:choline-sulfatase